MFALFRAAVAILAGLVLAAGCSDRNRREQDPPQSWQELYEAWTYPAPLPSFELTDQQGRRFQLGELRGSYVLVGFIYTRCPIAEACPLTTTLMRSVQARWQARQARLGSARRPNPSLRLLSITLDPAFDTPERLAAYARKHGADLSSWIFATGPEGLVTDALPSLLGVLALPRGSGDIQHSVKVALLAPDLTVLEEWGDNAFTPDQVIARISRAAAAAADHQGDGEETVRRR